MAEQPKPKSSSPDAIPAIFSDSFFIGMNASARRAFAFPVALIVHIILVGVLVVIPLLSTSNLPKIEITSAFLAPPPPPPPPPPQVVVFRGNKRTVETVTEAAEN